MSRAQRVKASTAAEKGRHPADERARQTAERVKAANRALYDAAADCYEALDGRRSPALRAWLRETLTTLQQRSGGRRLLDLGAGSGLLTECAKGLFDLRVGIDLSPRILALHATRFDGGAAADLDRLPFADQSFDVVTCFAVLHHLPAFDGLTAEVTRVLAPGGIFYSDHDMDLAFYRRFRPLLAVYRRLHDARSRYQQASSAISGELYDCAEWHQDGVPSRQIATDLQRQGLEVEARFHWFGLHPMADRLLGKRTRARGWAPLVALRARKPRTTPGR